MIVATGLVYLSIALVLWVLSYLFIVRKRAALIAGFDPAAIRDPGGYAVWVGWSTFLCGAGLVVTWALVAFEFLAYSYLLPGALLSASIMLVLSFVAAHRFSH